MEIPKKIHYCWFGDSPLGEKELTCINSWKTFFPDYEIVRWDETNFNMFSNKYVQEAYQQKKWAFVSDYARFHILNECGGIYFDTDVEVISDMSDIVASGPFFGCEEDGNGLNFSVVKEGQFSITVAAGLGMAAVPNMPFYRKVLESYANDVFVFEDGTLNQQSVVIRVTKLLIKEGLKNQSGIQEICGITIYPSEYFNPKNFNTGIISLSKNTRTIHHFSMSWLSPLDKRWIDVRLNLGEKYGKNGYRLYKLISIPYRVKKRFIDSGNRDR